MQKSMRGRTILLVIFLAMLLASCRSINGEPASNPASNPMGNPANNPANNNESPAEGAPPREDRFSEHAKAYARMMEQARAGETVDFYGDGSAFRMWTDEKGIRHTDGSGPPHNPHRYISETRPNGSYKSTYSMHADSIVDRQIEKTPGREIQLYDRNRAGFFNERLRLITLHETGMVHRIHEKRTSARGPWTVIKNSVVPPEHPLPSPEMLQSIKHSQLSTLGPVSL